MTTQDDTHWVLYHFMHRGKHLKNHNLLITNSLGPWAQIGLWQHKNELNVNMNIVMNALDEKRSLKNKVTLFCNKCQLQCHKLICQNVYHYDHCRNYDSLKTYPWQSMQSSVIYLWLYDAKWTHVSKAYDEMRK